MPATSLFRTILITHLLFVAVSVVAGFSLTNTLPQILQDYLAQSAVEDMSGGEAIFLMVALVVLLISIPITAIGLWKFKSWARSLYIIIALAFIPLYPFVGPFVTNSWEAMFADTALILEGALIAMMLTGEVSQKFRHSGVNSGN